MNSLHPVYTARTECQDCYKCIRECPVKAIKVESGYASVVPELCVCCGRCVESCPHNAKKVRNDLPKVMKLLASGKRLVVSLAPSFAAEFPSVEPEQVVAALKLLGFYAVSETALGAEQVSAHIAAQLKNTRDGVLLSSACPAAVEYLQKYYPRYAGMITGVLSPMLAHAGILRSLYGPGTGIVFIGPCVAKKREADTHPGLIDAVLTFEDLARWFQEKEIRVGEIELGPEDRFIPETACEGTLYPVEGGMITGIRKDCSATDAGFMTFSGLNNIARAIKGVEELHLDRPLFLELLACEGGCINGPKTAKLGALAAKRYRVIRYGGERAASNGNSIKPDVNGALASSYPPAPIENGEYSEAQVREALRSAGKYTEEDELNCGGCGYDSCRAFARASLAGHAERRMCVSYMRKLAEKKANILMGKMPAAIVMADENLRIVECNPNFIRFFRKEDEEAADPASLEGVDLASIAPFYTLFDSVLRTGEEIIDRDIRFNGSIYRASIFSVEPHSLVGATLMDVTEPAGRKEQIIERTRQVIQKNLETVQQIAYLIGENAAESEIALNTIVRSFSPEEQQDPADSSPGKREPQNGRHTINESKPRYG